MKLCTLARPSLFQITRPKQGLFILELRHSGALGTWNCCKLEAAKVHGRERERERESSYMKVKHMLKQSLCSQQKWLFLPWKPERNLDTLGPAVLRSWVDLWMSPRWRQAELCLLIWWDTGPALSALSAFMHLYGYICSHMFTYRVAIYVHICSRNLIFMNFSFYVFGWAEVIDVCQKVLEQGYGSQEDLRTDHYPWRILFRCCYINGVPWIPSIYPSHVSI